MQDGNERRCEARALKAKAVHRHETAATPHHFWLREARISIAEILRQQDGERAFEYRHLWPE